MDDDTIRAAFNAVEKRDDARTALVDILRAQMAEIKELLVHKEGRAYTSAELALVGDHKIKMLEGEIEAMWREIIDIKLQQKAVHSLITREPHWSTQWKTGQRNSVATDGPSPLAVDTEE